MDLVAFLLLVFGALAALFANTQPTGREVLAGASVVIALLIIVW